jgi:hypothetical protein
MKKFKWCGDKLYSSAVTGSENMFSTGSVILNERETVWKNVLSYVMCFISFLCFV